MGISKTSEVIPSKRTKTNDKVGKKYVFTAKYLQYVLTTPERLRIICMSAHGSLPNLT